MARENADTCSKSSAWHSSTAWISPSESAVQGDGGIGFDQLVLDGFGEHGAQQDERARERERRWTSPASAATGMKRPQPIADLAAREKIERLLREISAARDPRVPARPVVVGVAFARNAPAVDDAQGVARE